MKPPCHNHPIVSQHTNLEAKPAGLHGRQFGPPAGGRIEELGTRQALLTIVPTHCNQFAWWVGRMERRRCGTDGEGRRRGGERTTCTHASSLRCRGECRPNMLCHHVILSRKHRTKIRLQFFKHCTHMMEDFSSGKRIRLKEKKTTHRTVNGTDPAQISARTWAASASTCCCAGCSARQLPAQCCRRDLRRPPLTSGECRARATIARRATSKLHVSGATLRLWVYLTPLQCRGWLPCATHLPI